MQRWLVSGASGQLGGHVLRVLAQRYPSDHVHAIARDGLPGAHVTEWVDLRDGPAVAELLCRSAPTRILHLAAMSPEQAESDPPSCQALHVDVASQFAAYAAETGGWMLYASSDFVWDGNGASQEEGDEPRPANLYGRSKLAGERAVAVHACSLVARYSLLFGLPVDQRQTSWTKIAGLLERNEPVSAVMDEWRSPIGLADAAWATVELAAREQRGLVHIAGPSSMTSYDIVTMMRRELKSASEVRPMSRVSYSSRVVRPCNVSQSNLRLRRLLPHFDPSPLPSALQVPRMPSVRLSVIIPVYHGTKTIGRSLESLAAQSAGHGDALQCSDVEILLAFNDGRQHSEAAAQPYIDRLRAQNYRVRLLRTPPSRRAAIAAADRVASPDSHRLYLDQDARLSPVALSAIFSALGSGTGIHFVAPRGLFEPSPSRLVRAFCRYWRSLPYCDESPVTMGAYAVSAEGRRRWGELPQLASDDKFVRMLFAPGERCLLAGQSYHVLPPASWSELIRARRRYLRGNRELAAAARLRLRILFRATRESCDR